MGAPNASTFDLSLPMFGGRVTLYDPQTLPAGASPFNQDVIFPPGAVATRPGLVPFFAATIGGNPSIDYIKTFVISHNNNPLLALDSNGEFYAELVAGVLTSIGSTVAGAKAQSATAFGKEYIAFGDGDYGLGLPMQYDGTNFDRVSQSGPGQAGAIGDSFSASTNITSLTPVVLSIRTIERFSSGYITISFTSGSYPPNLATGMSCTIAGTVNYNGTWIVRYLNSDGSISVGPSTPGAGPGEFVGTVQFDLVNVVTATGIAETVGGLATISGTGGAPSTGTAQYDGSWGVVGVTSATSFQIDVTGGSQAIAGGAVGSLGAGAQNGSISAGTHGYTVIFITRQGYFTRPAPPAYWPAAGNFSATAGNIPVGPSNVVARVLAFTGANSQNFYIIPDFYIYDNTTTSFTVNFIDSDLEAGTDVTSLFNLDVLGECSTVASYSSRLFWGGERNKIQNLLNMDFDGGWNLGTGANGGDVPLGWAFLTGSIGKATREQSDVVWGEALRITCDTNTGTAGEISQLAYQDYLSVRILNDKTAYSARIKLTKSAGLGNACSFFIGIQSPTAGTIGSATVSAANIPSVGYQEFIVSLIDDTHTLPSDVLLNLALNVSGAGNNGQYVIADCLEIFPTVQPYLAGQVRGSYAVGNNPVASAEAYDSVTGWLIPGEIYGEIVHCFFRLLDSKLYIVKERSTYVTQDDGQNEPAFWNISPVSDVIGTPSVRGVDYGEGWSIIADHTGAYVFDGSVPIKISQEIQSDWATINWAYDNTMYVTVDRENKRIHIGAPVGVATSPNVEFVCDYSQLNGASEIADHPQAYYSTFAPGKLIAPGKARKWTIWNISCNCATVAIRNDGTYHLLRGNGTNTGKVYDQSLTQFSDDGVAISSQYQTYFFPELDQEQMLQLGAHEKHVDYLTGYTYGSGSFTMSIQGPQGARSLDLETIALESDAPWDDELNVNWEGVRFSLLFGTDAVGDHFTISKLCPSVSRSSKGVRGIN